MGTLGNAELLGTLEYATRVLVPWDTAYVPPGAPGSTRSKLPTDDPMPSDFFLNVPIGAGITAVSTSATITTHLRGLASNLNYNNWTDPVYKVLATDPACSVISCYQYQPTGAAGATNSTAVAGTGMGNMRWKYTSPDLRMPTAAAWQATTNTDRKVCLDYQYDITLTKTTYAADGVTVTNVETTFYPAGTLRIVVHKFQRITSSTAIFGTNNAQHNLVTGDGSMNEGAVASGIFEAGYMRAWEVAAALAGDKTACRHALKFGLSNASLLLGQVWPARTQDAPNPPYTGPVPYGTHIYLPDSFDEDAAAADTLSRAFLWTLKKFGAYVLIRAGGTGVITWGVEPRGAGAALTSTEANNVKAALNVARSSYLVSANSNLTLGTGAFTYSGSTRLPNRGVQDIAGGGVRRTVGLGLSDFDNVTGLKLPLPSAGPWV